MLGYAIVIMIFISLILIAALVAVYLFMGTDRPKAAKAAQGATVSAPDETRYRFKPGDTVVVKEDIGEYYADYPHQTVLVSTRGSTGVVASFYEFRADFERRLAAGDHGEMGAYSTYLDIVEDAIDQCAQCPVRWTKVLAPATPADLVRGQAGKIELVDTAKLAKAGGPPPEIYQGEQGAPAGAGYMTRRRPSHDAPKFNDMVLAMVLSGKGPITAEVGDIVYFHLTCLSVSHALWYHLKVGDLEAALIIVDTLRFPRHNHAGHSWEEVFKMIATNSARKPLWYNQEQRNALGKAIEGIQKLEKQPGNKLNRR
jgi:hypothetical protein